MKFYSRDVVSGAMLYERLPDKRADLPAQAQALRVQGQAWAAQDWAKRLEVLQQLAHTLAADKAILARMVSEEVGRCLRECEAELDKSVALIRYYATLAPQLLQPQIKATQASLSQVCFEPLGLVLAVMPWNYPIWQVIRFAIPALCAGNACWVKPAPSVARVSEALAERLPESLPLEMVWLADEEVETALALSDALAFTGSAQTGRHLAALAGQHLKKSVMELGGSNAFIVLADADLVQAAADACHSRFRDAGQSCNAAKRLIVEEAVADEFIALFLNECRQLRAGNPQDADTTLAPLHRKDIQLNVHAQVLDAIEHGARLLLGGELDEHSTFYPATVLDHISPQARMYREEVFGPAIGIFRANSVAEAIALANDNPFGLGASIYSADNRRAWEYAAQIQAGSVFINRHTSSDLRMPFGGIKDSGFGRELSEFGLYEFVNVKSYWQK